VAGLFVMARSDSAVAAGESGAGVARGIAAVVCLTRRWPSYVAGTESSRSFPFGPAAGILSSTIKIISGNDPQAGGDLRQCLPVHVTHNVAGGRLLGAP